MPKQFLTPFGKYINADDAEDIITAIYYEADEDDPQIFARKLLMGRYNDLLGDLLHAELKDICHNDPETVRSLID